MSGSTHLKEEFTENKQNKGPNSTPPKTPTKSSDISYPTGDHDFSSKIPLLVKFPESPSILETFIDIRKWWPTHAVIFGMFACECMFFVMSDSMPIKVALYVFWRLQYNVTLGYFLHQQSCYGTVTKFYEMATGWKKTLLDTILGSNHPASSKVFEQDLGFRAWCLFRQFADLILVGDSATTCFMAWCLWTHPSSTKDWIFIVIGSLITLLGFLAKVDAHRVIGDYSWYWGDFFFRINRHLVFDGVYEMFPHPMYTIGYAWYYGFALITRSNLFLLLSVFSHVGQLAFLVAVENPHILKLYGSESDSSAEMSSSGLVSMLGVPSDPELRTGPGFLISQTFIALYGLASSHMLSPMMALGQTILWKLVLTLGISWILHSQSKSKTWSTSYRTRGFSVSVAFREWKVVYAQVRALNVSLLVGTFFRFVEIPSAETFYTARYLSWTVLAICGLIWAIRTTNDARNHLGLFSWYFGDFFFDQDQMLEEKKKAAELDYTGVFRFWNNPVALATITGVYALALLSRSIEILVVAGVVHLCEEFFIKFVEEPHMIRTYGPLEVRNNSPMKRRIKRASNMGVQTLVKGMDKFNKCGPLSPAKTDERTVKLSAVERVVIQNELYTYSIKIDGEWQKGDWVAIWRRGVKPSRLTNVLSKAWVYRNPNDDTVKILLDPRKFQDDTDSKYAVVYLSKRFSKLGSLDIVIETGRKST